MKKQKKTITVIIGSLIVVLLVAGGVLIFFNNNRSQDNNQAETNNIEEITPTVTTLPNGMTEAEVEAATQAIEESSAIQTRAMIDGDIATLRELTAPNTTATHITGYVQPREEWYSQIESGYFDYHSVTPHSSVITFTDKNTATMVGRSTIDVTINGSRRIWNLESTSTWHRQNDGRWLGGSSSARTY